MSRNFRAGSKSLLADAYYQFASKTYRTEGIDNKDPLCIFGRKHVFEKVEEMLMDKVLLVKAPPRSSKTSTVRLIARNAIETKSYDQVLSLSGRSGLEKQIASQTSLKCQSFLDLLSSTEGLKTLVLIDEAQLTYDKAFPGYVSLWGGLKELMSNKDSLLDVVLFASYGEKGDSVAMPGMPIEFTARNTMNFNDLSFTKSETQNMVDKWNNLEPPAGPFLDSSGVTLVPKTMSDVVSLTSTVTNTIHTLASGHVGLTRFLIELIAERFLNHKRFCVPHYPVTEGEVMEYLLSEELQQAVGESRAVPSGWEQRDQEVVRRILMEGSVKQAESKELKDSFSRLKRIGLVADTCDEVMFTSPLLAMQAMDTLFGTVPGRPEEMPEFEKLLFNTVCRVNYTLLSRGKVCRVDPKDKKLHRTLGMQLQMEWYSAAIGLLPKSCTSIVNYGRFHPLTIGQRDEKGEDEEKFELVDFYLNCDECNKLGVDVIRNSEDLEERTKRFEAGGKYSGIPLTQWKVVNFVEVRGEPESHALKQKGSVHDGELRILWSPDSVYFVALDADGETFGKFVTE